MKIVFAFFILLLTPVAFADVTEMDEELVFHIYQDADLSNHSQSSFSIQKGIEVAFGEVGNEVAGYKVKFVYLDHRGNVVRSKHNFQSFLDDNKALAIFSGMHSPPLIKNREFINENKILTLVPWAAGAPVTRYPSAENWIFRLSIDDKQAANVIVDFTMKEKACKQPHLLLEETPWGDTNLQGLRASLLTHGISASSVTRFGLNLSPRSARVKLRKIVDAESDCIVLVSNAMEGSVIARAMLDLPLESRRPIISHWGITGGDFHKEIKSVDRTSLDLSFIQTCFAFTSPNQSEMAKNVFQSLTKHTDGMIGSPSDLKSAVGFIHAYDLTKILIAALNQAKLSGDIVEDRNAIRLALEDLHLPVEGLVKRYDSPFGVFDEIEAPNAHEALASKHYCMAKYGASDEVLILK